MRVNEIAAFLNVTHGGALRIMKRHKIRREKIRPGAGAAARYYYLYHITPEQLEPMRYVSRPKGNRTAGKTLDFRSMRILSQGAALARLESALNQLPANS
ncbi:hypothetical protein SAMN05421881_101164 [Nitrosomonas halophila]|uniref:Uncharacterized protein n=2 Tax=Nitrosomonas halophila TaxID=44576 RepID=A0A1H3FE58_9PROT|nr:hypothetical protein SAMN05421881_101164 [Nitrosomonas halophila]